MNDGLAGLDKRMTLDEIIGQLQDGMTIGIGGWGGRRKPMALVRAIVRSRLQDLTIVAYGGPDVGMLCAAGKVRRLIFGFVSLDALPLDAHFRKARQAGAFAVSEIDEGMLQWGLRAAGMRLPFLPTRAGLGTDVLRHNDWLRTVRSPFEDAEELVAVPAIRLDAALVHVHEADVRGNSITLSPDPFFDDLFCRAADRVYMSCERIVPTERLGTPERIRYNQFERSLVSGVIELPYGAHPTAGTPEYGIDVHHLQEYTTAAETGFAAYRAKYIDLPDHASYVKAAGGSEYLATIQA